MVFLTKVRLIYVIVTNDQFSLQNARCIVLLCILYISVIYNNFRSLSSICILTYITCIIKPVSPGLTDKWGITMVLRNILYNIFKNNLNFYNFSALLF